jgi:hypothetical protein
MAGYCEHNKESSGLINDRELLGQMTINVSRRSHEVSTESVNTAYRKCPIYKCSVSLQLFLVSYIPNSNLGFP